MIIFVMIQFIPYCLHLLVLDDPGSWQERH